MRVIPDKIGRKGQVGDSDLHKDSSIGFCRIFVRGYPPRVGFGFLVRWFEPDSQTVGRLVAALYLVWRLACRRGPKLS